MAGIKCFYWVLHFSTGPSCILIWKIEPFLVSYVIFEHLSLWFSFNSDPIIMYKRNISRGSALVLLYLHVFKKSVQRKTTVLISVDHMILKLSFFAEFFLLLVACACCNSNLVFALAKRNDKLFAKNKKVVCLWDTLLYRLLPDTRQKTVHGF